MGAVEVVQLIISFILFIAMVVAIVWLVVELLDLRYNEGFFSQENRVLRQLERARKKAVLRMAWTAFWWRS